MGDWVSTVRDHVASRTWTRKIPSIGRRSGHVFLTELHALHDKEELDEDDEDFMDIDDVATVTSAESVGSNNNGTTSSTGKQPSLEELLLDTWDQGVKANSKPLPAYVSLLIFACTLWCRPTA